MEQGEHPAQPAHELRERFVTSYLLMMVATIMMPMRSTTRDATSCVSTLHNSKTRWMLVAPAYDVSKSNNTSAATYTCKKKRISEQGAAPKKMNLHISLSIFPPFSLFQH